MLSARTSSSLILKTPARYCGRSVFGATRSRALPPTLSYEIRCGTHRCGVSSTHGYECIHTIPYDGCNLHTVIVIRPLSVRTYLVRRDYAKCSAIRNWAIRAIRNSAKCSGNLAGKCPLKLLFGWSKAMGPVPICYCNVLRPCKATEAPMVAI